MSTTVELLQQALCHHHSGHFDLAENLYRQILQADPRHADAWHLLGVIAGQVGQHEVAVEHINQALRINPDFSEAHFNLGNAHRDQGKPNEAERCYHRALQLKPDFAEAYYNLGNVLRTQGKIEEAEISYRQALRCRSAYAEAHHHLGIVLRIQGLLEEAEACHREALRLKPGYVEALNNLGIVLGHQGKLEVAQASYRAALRVAPGYAEVHSNLGNILHSQGKLEEAEACHREALRLKPDFADAHSNLGIVLGDQGKLQEAAACFREALRLKPDYAEAHYNLSFYCLLHGDLAQGWAEQEWRLRIKKKPGAGLPPPTWDGKSLNGQTILLQAEQGLGDSFQFIRYAPLVKAKAGRVLLQCPPALIGVLSGCPGIDHLVGAETPMAGYQVTAPLMSLPWLCGTTLETIPAEVPYLFAESARVDRWRARLEMIPGRKVGICWQGNPAFKYDRQRSVPLAYFAPLAAMPGVNLIALQRGPGLEQIEQYSDDLSVIDLPGRSEDPAEGWLDTAALIQSLDLVISSDNGVVHLAGALGAPAWVALPFIPDWRWLLNREDSPWYPTLRLFRQRQPGDWAEVFQRMAAELQSYEF